MGIYLPGGRSAISLHINGRPASSAWLGGKKVWSAVSGEVWESVFTMPNNDETLSSYLTRNFGNKVWAASGGSYSRDFPMLRSTNVNALTMYSYAGRGTGTMAGVNALVAASGGSGIAPNKEWMLCAKLSPSMKTDGTVTTVPVFLTSYFGLGLGSFGTDKLFYTGPELYLAYNGYSFTDSSGNKGDPAMDKLPDKGTFAEYGEITMWYRDGKIRFYKDFAKRGEVEMSNYAVSEYLPYFRTRVVESKKSLEGPPPIKYFAAYTGIEARNRAVLWGMANENGDPK